MPSSFCAQLRRVSPTAYTWTAVTTFNMSKETVKRRNNTEPAGPFFSYCEASSLGLFDRVETFTFF